MRTICATFAMRGGYSKYDGPEKSLAAERELMKKFYSLLFIFVVFPLFVYSQTLDEKLKEIDAYSNIVMAEWKGPGMAIAIVKDDKVIFSKGYGVKRLLEPNRAVLTVPNNSPAEGYTRLFYAVKSKNTDEIKREMSVSTHGFADSVSAKRNQQQEAVYRNGFTATTFSATLPQMRDERVNGRFAAIEVYNEKDGRWEETCHSCTKMVLGGWRLVSCSRGRMSLQENQVHS